MALIGSTGRARGIAIVAETLTPFQTMTSDSNTLEARADKLERWLILEFGPVLKGAPLRQLLGYTSANAFRQAVHRRTIPVPLAVQDGQIAWSALTRDVARWMAKIEVTLAHPNPAPTGAYTPDEEPPVT
jgi:hypothetical protein